MTASRDKGKRPSTSPGHSNRRSGHRGIPEPDTGRGYAAKGLDRPAPRVLTDVPGLPAGDLASAEDTPVEPVQAPTTKVLNRLVDSLHVRISEPRLPSDWLMERVSKWRAHLREWREGQDPLTEVLPGIGTFVLMRGKRRYEFVLASKTIGDIRIWKPESWDRAISTQTGQFYLDFRSVFLQIEGTHMAEHFMNILVRLLCCWDDRKEWRKYPKFRRVARLDLACDTQEPRDMKWSDLESYVCRCNMVDIHTPHSDMDVKDLIDKLGGRDALATPPLDNKGGPKARSAKRVDTGVRAVVRELMKGVKAELKTQGTAAMSRVVATRDPQTVYFGKLGSAMYARRYNKLAEIGVTGKAYMKDVWARAGWDEDSPVWRLEFSLSGDKLREFQLPDASVHDLREMRAALDAIPAMWAYLTDDWLRFCDRVPRKRPGLWPVAASWRVVAGAWDRAVPVYRAELPRKLDAPMLIKQAAGCLLSAAAIRAKSDDTPDEMHAIAEIFRKLADSGMYSTLQTERRRELGVDDWSQIFADEGAKQVESEWGTPFVYQPDVDQGPVETVPIGFDTKLTAEARADRIAEGYGS